MLSTQTNTSSLTAQNNVSRTQKNMTASMERLSTGMRINSAADDAAGMQIANRMETQIRGMDVAMRNANDAISMAQTAEGGMVETTNMLNRVRDLSLQAANDTNTQEDRDALQAEVEQMIGQINDIASQTTFAGIPLMSENQTLSFQVGANANETIQFSLTDMSASALKGDVTGVNIGSGLTKGAGDLVSISVKSTGGETVNVDLTSAATDKDVVDLINSSPDMQRLEIEAGFNEQGDIELSGNNLKDPSDVKLKEGKAYAPPPTTIPKDEKDFPVSTVKKSVADIDVSSQAGAQQAIQILDGALPQVDTQRAELGAVQNRLEYTISNLQNTQENLSTSQSHIQDVDFASETAELTKQQMMMQSGTTVLAQAKQMPQYAVQLLG